MRDRKWWKHWRTREYWWQRFETSIIHCDHYRVIIEYQVLNDYDAGTQSYTGISRTFHEVML
jgi:hypothetical protein